MKNPIIILLKNLIIFFKNIFRKHKSRYLTKYGEYEIKPEDWLPRSSRKISGDEVGFISDDRIQELSNDYNIQEIRQWE